MPDGRRLGVRRTVGANGFAERQGQSEFTLGLPRRVGFGYAHLPVQRQGTGHLLRNKPGPRAATRQKLLHITTVPMTLGFLRGQLGFMQSNGFTVCVMSSPGVQLDEFAAKERVESLPVEMARRITPFRDLVAVARMVRTMRRLRPDIVHASTPKGGLLGTIAARIARVPVVIYHLRGLPFTGAKGWQRWLLQKTEMIACAFSHRVLCVSPSVRDELVASRIARASKTVVLAAGSSNGVDAEKRFNPSNYSQAERSALRQQLGIPDNAHVVGFVGRLVKDKGIIELESAWNEIHAEFPDSWLMLVGPWEARDAVPDDLKMRLASHPRVTVTGEQRDVAPYYSIMDVLALPTYREGFPNAPLEAGAMEVPVVCTRVTGCVDAVVDGETGLLVDVRNAGQLGEALSLYLADPALRVRHGKAGRIRALQEYRPESVWSALLGYYRALLKDRGVAG